jgi:hypothetical protein
MFYIKDTKGKIRGSADEVLNAVVQGEGGIRRREPVILAADAAGVFTHGGSSMILCSLL